MPEIQTVQKGEHALIGQIIADGFRDDPVNRWAFNGDAAMLPMFTHMAQYLYIPKGYGHRTADGCAGTLWLPPGTKKGYGVTGNLKMSTTLAQHAGTRGTRNSLQIDRFLKDRTPSQPHHYLFAIAVHPSLQGKGVGGQLMRTALSSIDAKGESAYLENSKERNIPFYQSHGFEIMEEVHPGSDSPPMWLMWREGRRTV